MLEALKGIKVINHENIVDMNALQIEHPEMFRPDNSMIYHIFEEKIRPFNFIYVRQDVNSLSFTLQRGDRKEVGKNGCRAEDIIEVAMFLLKDQYSKDPCEENSHTLDLLAQALYCQDVKNERKHEERIGANHA